MMNFICNTRKWVSPIKMVKNVNELYSSTVIDHCIPDDQLWLQIGWYLRNNRRTFPITSQPGESLIRTSCITFYLVSHSWVQRQINFVLSLSAVRIYKIGLMTSLWTLLIALHFNLTLAFSSGYVLIDFLVFSLLLLFRLF